MFNGKIWKTISMALKSRGLSDQHWQTALPNAIHSSHSILCSFLIGFLITVVVLQPEILCLMYEILDLFSRSVIFERTRRIVCSKVGLIQVNSHYAYIQYKNGEETTVPTRL